MPAPKTFCGRNLLSAICAVLLVACAASHRRAQDDGGQTPDGGRAPDAHEDPVDAHRDEAGALDVGVADASVDTGVTDAGFDAGGVDACSASVEVCDGLDQDCDGHVDETTSCALPRATSSCEFGSCVVTACDGAFDDCNAVAGDGCEADLANDRAHCGSCDNACGLTETCDGGMCRRERITYVSAGFQTCVVLESGRVLCWGQFYDDALPLDRARYAVAPEEVVLPFAIEEVAPLYNGSCALGSGRVVCWGDNRHGELGTGELGPHRDPVEVRLPEPAIQVATDSFTLPCARTASGVWCWGQVSYTTTITSSPELIAGLVGDERLQSGLGSVYALRDGSAWVWGFNPSPNTFPSHSTSGGTRSPVVAELPSGIVRVYPGSVAGFGLTDDGTLYSWGGHGGAGELGREPILGRAEPPAPVTGFPPLVDFAANSTFGCGLDRAGTLSCWHIGRVSIVFHTVALPEPVSRLWGGASVNSSVCVVSLDRTRLWCFGPNGGAQVGDGTMEYRPEPVAVIGFE